MRSPGASGAPAGDTVTGSEGAEIPAALVAVTEKRYVWPLDSPVTVQLSEPVVVHWSGPSESV